MILFNLLVDFQVSRQAHQLLNVLHNRPLLDVEGVNPMLFNFVEELCEIRVRVRELRVTKLE